MENAFGTLASIFRVLLATMEQRSKVIRDLVLTCIVLHNIPRTRQGEIARAPNPQDEVSAVVNELAVCVPDGNCKNPLRR